MRLAPYRIVLLLTFVPLFLIQFGGMGGKLRSTDVLVLLYVVWAALALFANHPAGEVWQTTGIFAAEGLGAYLLGRVLIRDARTFVVFCKMLFWALAGLMPFIVLEAMTGERLISEIFRGAFAVYFSSHAEMRWGMFRAAGPFEHAILLGVFTSTGLTLLYFGLKALPRARLSYAGLLLAGAATFFSLSLGPFLAAAISLGMVGYDRVFAAFKARWTVLLVSILSVLLLLEILSNRGPVVIMINLLAFNEFGAWQRVLVFEFGRQVIGDNPLFGVGLVDWRQPGWLVTDSIDNFWLLNGVRYGMPAMLLIMAAFLTALLAVSRAKITDPVLINLRKGWAFTMVSLCIALVTVHVWNAAFSYFMFIIGSGMWLVDQGAVARPVVSRRKRRGEFGKSGVDGGENNGDD